MFFFLTSTPRFAMTCRNWAVLSILFLLVWGPRACTLVKVRGDFEGEILLPCFTETPLSLEELKVEWKRADSKAMVYLYQGGGGKPESQNNAYMNRASFFADEAMKGNYSLLLHNATENDAGDYICSVYGKEKYLECTVAVTETEYLVVSGTDLVVTSNVGKEVIMTCSVHSHNPPEEVSWKKLDSDKSPTLVILFQDNETYPYSGHESYHGRVTLFASEILKGNFSLRLKDVKTEDRGQYICEAHSGQLSASTSVFMELGLSSMHILVLTLCVAAVILAFGVSVILVANKEITMSSALVLHCVLAIGPGVIMVIAFVLWGVIEGQQGEVATCSTLSLTRLILLVKTSQCTEELCEMYRNVKDFLSNNCYFLEYITITSVLSWAIFYNIWHTEGESKALAFVGMTSGLSLHMGIKLFFGGKGFLEMMDFFFLFTVSFGSRTLREDVFKNMFSVVMGISVLFWLLLLIERIRRVERFAYLGKSELCRLAYLVFVLFMRLIISAVIFHFFFQILEPNEELAGFLWTTALLHLLALCGIYDCLTETKLAEKPKEIFYMCGACGLIAVNAIVLTSELILKWKRGERTIADLRVVVVPCEMAFVLGWMVLWSHAYCDRYQDGIRAEVEQLWHHGCSTWRQELKNKANHISTQEEQEGSTDTDENENEQQHVESNL